MGNHPGVAETGWGNRMSKQLDWRHISSCSVSVRHSNRCRCTGSNLWALRPSCTACSRHRGAWAVSLSRGLGVRESASRDGKPNIELVRRLVHRSGVLVNMMTMSRWRYRLAARLAGLLGAERLSHWAREQELIEAALAERESGSAGYVVRAHKLSNWATEVLS